MISADTPATKVFDSICTTMSSRTVSARNLLTTPSKKQLSRGMPAGRINVHAISTLLIFTMFFCHAHSFVHQLLPCSTHSTQTRTGRSVSLSGSRHVTRSRTGPMMLEPTTLSMLGLTALSSLTKAAARKSAIGCDASRKLESSGRMNGLTQCCVDSACGCPPSSNEIDLLDPHCSCPSCPGETDHSDPVQAAVNSIKTFKNAVQQDPIRGSQLALRATVDNVVHRRLLEEEFPIEAMTIDDFAQDGTEQVLSAVDNLLNMVQASVKAAPHKVSLLSELFAKSLMSNVPFKLSLALLLVAGLRLIKCEEK